MTSNNVYCKVSDGILGQFVFHWLVLAMIHLRTKFELSSFNHSGDKRGSRILNESHVTRDPGHAPFVGAFCLLSVSTCHDAPTNQI